jgi:dynein heavy chain
MQDKLGEDMRTLLGDSILATAFLVYLGPYEGSYRTDMMYNWQKLVIKFQIHATPNFNLSEILGNEEKLADWQINGIPQDGISVDNMIIIEETK